MGLLDNLRTVTAAIRTAGIQIFIVPHHRWEPGDYEGWDHPSPYQVASGETQIFAKGTWGGEWHPDFVPQQGDIIIKEHWGASGFANTDLDFQLKQQGIDKVIVIGLLANTCIESHQPLRDGARLSRHAGQGRNGGIQPGNDARRA